VIKGFTTAALAALSRYSWPGNIRELQNVIERAALLCTGDVIRPEYLSELAVAPGVGPRRRAEKLRRIEQALEQTGGNHAAAARLLGVSPNNLARMIKNLSAKLPPSIH
jgi:DNA-binding NtrC family response regulator